jgi:hypothetical protein
VDLQDFTLDIPHGSVVLGDPAGTLTSWDGTFHWTGVTAATWYYLEVKDANGNVVIGGWYPAKGNCVGFSCSLNPEGAPILSNGDYHWRVYDYGPSYGYGPTVPQQDFTLNR